MNLNSASERELTQLPRIGPDKARKIVRNRVIRKGFRDWTDFASTLGMTETDVEALRSRAWVGPFSESATFERHLRRPPRGAGTVRRPRPRTA